MQYCKYCGTEIFWRRISGRIRAFAEATGCLHTCRGYQAVHPKKSITQRASPILALSEKLNKTGTTVDTTADTTACYDCSGVVVGGRCINCGRKAKELKPLKIS
jgi:hypothetical protein